MAAKEEDFDVPQTEEADQDETHDEEEHDEINNPTLPKIKNMSMNLMVSASNQRHPNNITTAKFLKKITHLNCNDKKIQSMNGGECNIDARLHHNISVLHDQNLSQHSQSLVIARQSRSARN